MKISLIAFVVTFLGQLYFWISYFFTLLQCSYFDTAVNFLEQLFLQGSWIFWADFFRKSPSSQQLFFQSYFFRAKLLPRSQFLRIGSSIGQLLFGTANFLTVELLRIKISTEEVLFRSRNFCTASTFSEEPHFRKN